MADKKKSNTTFSSLIEKLTSDPVGTVENIISVTEPELNKRANTWSRHQRKYRRGLTYLQENIEGIPLYFTNYLFSTVETVKANMCRYLPNVTVRPQGFKDDLAADYLTQVLRNSMDKAGFVNSSYKVIHNGVVKSMGWYRVTYSRVDDDTNNNVIESIAPEFMLLDPMGTDWKNPRWIGHKVCNVPVEQIFMLFGKVPDGAKNRRDTDIKGLYDDTDITENDFERGLYDNDQRSGEFVDMTDNYDLYELWFRDWDTESENKWYRVIYAGGSILDKGYSVYEHNKHPYVPWFDGEDEGADNLYLKGVGEIEEIEPLQDRDDALNRKMYNNISLLSNRIKYVSAQSGLVAHDIDNRDGRVHTVQGDPSKAVYYDAPPMMNRDIYEYANGTPGLMQVVSGIFDVTQGKRPTGITAGRAIESLKDSADVRLTHKYRLLAQTCAEVGLLCLHNILQFFTGRQLIRANDADKDQDFLITDVYPPELQPEVVPQQNPETGEPMLAEDGQSFVPEDTDAEIPIELEQARLEWKAQNNVALVLEEISLDWDVLPTTDSALPAARAERAQSASDLFRLGAIDREALLTDLDYPNRHKILQRLAKEVTGRNAGDASAEAGKTEIDAMLSTFTQVLQEMGLPEDSVQQVIQAVVQQVAGGTQQDLAYKPQQTQ